MNEGAIEIPQALAETVFALKEHQKMLENRMNAVLQAQQAHIELISNMVEGIVPENGTFHKLEDERLVWVPNRDPKQEPEVPVD